MARKKRSTTTTKPTKAELEVKARREALELTMEQITKRCGTGSIMVLGQDFKTDIPPTPIAMSSHRDLRARVLG